MPRHIIWLTDHEAALALAKEREAIRRGQAWQCPLCRGVSYSPADIHHQFCGCCGNPGMPKLCPHRPSATC